MACFTRRYDAVGRNQPSQYGQAHSGGNDREETRRELGNCEAYEGGELPVEAHAGSNACRKLRVEAYASVYERRGGAQARALRSQA
jgi:hypothetical protein